MTIQEKAKKIASEFVTKTRPDGSKFVDIKDDSLNHDTISEFVRIVHKNLRTENYTDAERKAEENLYTFNMPDDFVYRAIEKIVDGIAEATDEEIDENYQPYLSNVYSFTYDNSTYDTIFDWAPDNQSFIDDVIKEKIHDNLIDVLNDACETWFQEIGCHVRNGLDKLTI